MRKRKFIIFALLLLLLSHRIWGEEPCGAHDFQPFSVQPTCTESGYEGERCSYCGQIRGAASIPQLGHDWGDWTVITEPDSQTEGLHSHACKVCGETAEEIMPPWSNPFSDLDEEAFYYESVLWASNTGITTGTNETHFSPFDVCTRAQIVTFLWRWAGAPEASGDENPFMDVAADAYYYDAVLWAVNSGVTKGVDERHFAPEQVCTRCQVVTFLHRFELTPGAAGEEPFDDVLREDYFYESVRWAYETGITTGTTETTFSPHRDCTRSEIVTFLYRAEKE